jgi:pyridoxal 5-phosphate dependent beta-lyase
MATTEVWTSWRDARPAVAGLHVDSAAAGRSSPAVLAAVAEHARREATEGAYVAADRAAATLGRLRCDVAGLMGVSAEHVVFVESATAALAAALRVAGPPRGATVAVAPTEWGPNLWAFRAAGLSVQRLDVDGAGRIDLDALDRLLRTAPPSFVHVVHQASHRAVRQPLAEIIGRCGPAGVAVWVDAAQSLGAAEVARGASVVYAPSRKWLAGPRGVGMLGFAADAVTSLRLDAEAPPRPGAGPLDGIESHEAHIAGRVGLAVAVAELAAVGLDAVARRLDEVGRVARESLAGVEGWRVVDAVDAAGSITALEPTAGQDVFAERARLMDRFSIVTTACATARAPLDMRVPLLRLSPHVDTTADDLATLAAALSPSA